MTEVTVENFDDLFGQITNEISNCSFASIHVQLTDRPLTSCSTSTLSSQTSSVVYHKLRESAATFIPCQVGLSIFRRRHQTTSAGFKCCVYTFSLCPRFYDPRNSRVFAIHTATAELLHAHGFDFNRMISQGISFMNDREEGDLRHRLGCAGSTSASRTDFRSLTSLSSMSSNSVGRLPTPPPLDAHEQTLVDLTHSLMDWRDNLSKAPTNTSTTNQAIIRLTFPPLPNELHSYLLIRHLRQKFTDLWIELDPLDENVLLVRQVTPIEREELESDTLKFENEIIVAHLVGFSRLFRTLVESKKPIVGCELLLPLIHCVQHFLRPLPEHLSNFRATLLNTFPQMFDVRELFQQGRQHPNTAKPLAFISHDLPLHQLYQRLQSPEICSQLPKEPEVLCVERDDDVVKPGGSGSPTSLSSVSLAAANQADRFRISSSLIKNYESGHMSYIAGMIFIKLAHWMSPAYLKHESISFDQMLQSLSKSCNRLQLSASGTSVWDLTDTTQSLTTLAAQEPQSSWVWIRDRFSGHSIRLNDLEKLIHQSNVIDVICVKRITGSEVMVELSNELSAQKLCQALRKDSNYSASMYPTNLTLPSSSSHLTPEWSGLACAALAVTLVCFVILGKIIRK